MPPPGFKAITVTDEFFDWFDNIYAMKKIRRELHPGITSFALFFSEQLDLAVKENKSMSKFISKILYVPEKFTQNTLTIKNSKPVKIWPKYYPPNY